MAQVLKVRVLCAFLAHYSVAWCPEGACLSEVAEPWLLVRLTCPGL